jgi:hypothetical protein
VVIIDNTYLLCYYKANHYPQRTLWGQEAPWKGQKMKDNTSTLRRPSFGEGSFAMVMIILTTALLFGLGWALMASGVASAAPEQKCSLTASSGVLDEQMVSMVAEGMASYKKVGQEVGVHWGVLAGIHYREASLSHSNPVDSDHGVMGLVTLAGQHPGLFPRGQVLRAEQFEDQLRRAAEFLKLKAKQRPVGSVSLKYSSSLADYGRALHEYYGHLAEFDQVAKGLKKEESWEVNPYVVNHLEGYPTNLTLFQVDRPDIIPDQRAGALTIATTLSKICGEDGLLLAGPSLANSPLQEVGQMADALSSLPVNGLGALGVMLCAVLLLLANIKRLMAWPLGNLVVVVALSTLGALWHYLDMVVATQPETLGLVGLRSGTAILLLLMLILFLGQGAKEVSGSNNMLKVLWRRMYVTTKAAIRRLTARTQAKVKAAPNREKAIAASLLGVVKTSVAAAILLAIVLVGAVVATMWLILVTMLESLSWVVCGGYRQLMALGTVTISYLVSSRWVFGSMPFMAWLLLPLILLCLLLVIKAGQQQKPQSPPRPSRPRRSPSPSPSPRWS